jgi:hypothetical protein
MDRATAPSTFVAETQNVRRVCLRMLSTAAMAVAIVMTPEVAQAQAIAPLGVRPTTPTEPDSTPRVANAVDYPPADVELISRIGLGIIGTTVGTISGAFAGAQVAKGCHFDECAWGDAVLGGIVGGVLGSAIAAGIPAMGSKCSSAARIGVAAGTALVTGILGGVIGVTARGSGVIIGFATGTSLGSGLGASICR